MAIPPESIAQLLTAEELLRVAHAGQEHRAPPGAPSPTSCTAAERVGRSLR
jgi:hypothetical protein